MAVKLRLQRYGRGKRPFYHIVAADSRARRDGKYIERIGDYNPLTKPATINVDVDKALSWLLKGAEPTETVGAVLKYKGVLYKKHLQRGVTKGALTQEAADKMFTDWQDSHKNTVLDHQHKAHKDKVAVSAKLLTEETRKKEERERKRQDALNAANAAANPVAEEAPVEAEAPATEEAAPAIAETPATEAPATEGTTTETAAEPTTEA
jgi:small subunit ribosomal protein S16